MKSQGSMQGPESLLNFSLARRLPVILQTEAAECGLVCLAMISGFYGYETDISSLRRRFTISSHGTTLRTLMDMAGRMNLSSRPLKLEMEQLAELQVPCMLHWDMNHFVVLKKVGARKIVIHDPAIGERQLDSATFAQHFTGVALELSPTDTFEAKTEKHALTLNHFWQRIVGLKRSLLQIILLSLLLQVFSVVSPFYMQTVVDDVLLRNDESLLAVLAFGFGLLLIIEVGTSTLREWVILHLSSRLNIQMAANVFRHLIRLPLDYFAKRHIGDVVSRFGSLDSVRELLTTGLVSAFVDGVMAVITLVVMSFYDLTLTAIVLVVVALYAGLRVLLFRPLRLLNEEQIVAQAKHDSHFMESVRAIQTVKLFQRENDRQSQWHNLLANTLNKGIRIQRWNIGYASLNKLLFGTENLIVVYVAAMAVMDNAMSVGMLFAFMSYKSRFVSSMDGLVSQWIELKMLGLHLERLSDVLFTPTEAVDNHTFFLPASPDGGAQELEGKIEVRNLSFRYGEAESPVFENISFTVHAGETVAIVGPSGCGKTTLLKCLMGLMEASEGTILIDGKPLSQRSAYRSQIAAVMQDDQLLNGSLLENIACFTPHVNTEQVIACAQMASIHEDIMNMPMQYNTLVGDMGSSLSGGQKQRIVLARALYRNPRILFMDEATSHLDIHSESRVNNHIKQLSITRIMVAHRPETVKSCGRVIDLGALQAHPDGPLP